MRAREKVFIVGSFHDFQQQTALDVDFLAVTWDPRAFDDDLYQAAAEALFLYTLCQSNTHMLTNFRTTFFAS